MDDRAKGDKGIIPNFDFGLIVCYKLYVADQLVSDDYNLYTQWFQNVVNVHVGLLACEW